MKRLVLPLFLSLVACTSSYAALFSTTYNTGLAIPNGSLDGVTDTRTISGVGGPIEDLQVTLNFSGGYNSDLYVYLQHGSQMVVLLNRIGISSSDAFGNSGSGMVVTLAGSSANGNIHNYSGSSITSGIYTADGRAISPISAASAFDAAGTTSLANFNGANANGSWTLYIADVVGGGNNFSTLNSWSLDITAVPEPTTIALGCFAGLFGVAGLLRTERVQKLLRLRSARK